MDPRSIDWPAVHTEMHRAGATLKSSWLKHRDNESQSYEQFGRSYRQWRSSLNLSMRPVSKAGRELLVSCAEFPNQSLFTLDENTGEVLPANLFIAVLPASRKCFAQVYPSKEIDTWISFHDQAFSFFGGTPHAVQPEVVPDCDLGQHELYVEMARRYGVKIVHGKDRTKLELPGRLLNRYLMRKIRALLASQESLGMAELNAVLKPILDELNSRRFKKISGSPREWFDLFEKEALTALSPEMWLYLNVTNDCHLQINGHYYSVPYQLAGQNSDVRVTSDFVEIFFKGRVITSHRRVEEQSGRSSSKSQHSKPDTAEAWSAARVINWSTSVGPATNHIVNLILKHAQDSQPGIRSCLGLLSLEKEYGRARLEVACRRAISSRSWTVSGIRKMLVAGLDQSSIQLTIPELIVPAVIRMRKRPE